MFFVSQASNIVTSGQRLHNYGKSRFFNGKIHYFGPCSIAMFQRLPGRVTPIQSHEQPPFSYGFPMVFLYGFPGTYGSVLSPGWANLIQVTRDAQHHSLASSSSSRYPLWNETMGLDFAMDHMAVSLGIQLSEFQPKCKAYICNSAYSR